MTFVAVARRQEASISSSGLLQVIWMPLQQRMSMQVSNLVRQTVLEDCESFSLMRIVRLPSSDVKLS